MCIFSHFFIFFSWFLLPEAWAVCFLTLCSEQFHCPGGDAEPTHLCPAGSRCVAWRITPELCPGGSFHNQVGQAQCRTCPAGWYCPEGSVWPLNCPAGQFCPNGTEFTPEFPCPAGTFSNETTTMLSSSANCTACSVVVSGALRGSSVRKCLRAHARLCLFLVCFLCGVLMGGNLCDTAGG